MKHQKHHQKHCEKTVLKVFYYNSEISDNVISSTPSQRFVTRLGKVYKNKNKNSFLGNWSSLVHQNLVDDIKFSSLQLWTPDYTTKSTLIGKNTPLAIGESIFGTVHSATGTLKHIDSVGYYCKATNINGDLSTFEIISYCKDK